jgi:hypothetical protein
MLVLDRVCVDVARSCVHCSEGVVVCSMFYVYSDDRGQKSAIGLALKTRHRWCV